MRASARKDLTSPRHPLLKRLRQALRRGELTPEGECAIEGVHLLEEAFRSQVEVAAVVAAESAEPLLRRFQAAPNRSTNSGRAGRPRAYLISDRTFDSLTQTETPQGIAALVRLPTAQLEDSLAAPQALVAVLTGLQDPGNLGTILRALEAFGGTACLLTPNTVSPFNPKAVRASAGSLFRVPVFRRLEAEKSITLCRRHGVRTVGLAPRAGQRLNEIDLKTPVAFLIGQEASGLPPGLLGQVDAAARIPLAAPVESLNAAVAAGVALYETARQRGLTE